MAVAPESVLVAEEYGLGVVAVLRGPNEGEDHAFVMSMLAPLDPITGVGENPRLSSTGAAIRTTSASSGAAGEPSTPAPGLGVTNGRGVIRRSDRCDALCDGHSRLLGT